MVRSFDDSTTDWEDSLNCCSDLLSFISMILDSNEFDESIWGLVSSKNGGSEKRVGDGRENEGGG